MNERILPEPRRDLAAIALLLCLGALLFADVLFLGRSLYLRDLTRYYYPTKRIVREVMLSGEMPYWNRYYEAGQPMAANPEYEVFYPPQWLILLPSYNLGYRLHIVFHIWASLVGMYLLLRSLRLRIWSALFGAMAFGLGGLVLSLVNLLPILFCATWIPWILIFVRRTLLVPTVRDFSLAGLFLGLQALSAEPTTLVQTWFLICMYALYRAWYSPPRLSTGARNLLLSGMMIGSGLLVGAVQILPAADHVGESARSRPFDFGLVTTWSMPFGKPLEMIYPNIFGHMSRAHVSWLWGSGMYRNTGSGFYYNIYCSLLLIALALAGFAVRPRGGRLILMIAGFASLIALGEHTPLFKVLYHLGLAKTIRYPEKFALMGIFAVIVFASMMFDRMARGDREVLQAAIGILLATSVFAGVATLFTFTPWYQSTFVALWGTRPASETKFMTQLYQVDWAVATVRGLVFAGLLYWADRRRVSQIWLATLLIVVAIDMGYVVRELIPTFPRAFFDPPPVAQTLPPDHASYRVFHEADWYGGADPARQYFATGSAVYWLVRNGMLPMTPAIWGVHTVLERDYDKTALLPTIDFVDAMWKVRDRGKKDWAEAFMAMSNARFRGVYVPFGEEKKRVGGQMQNGRPVRFVEAPQENPRYYFADQLVKAGDPQEFIDKLVKTSWSRRVGFVPFRPFKPAAGTVLSTRETNNTASIVVDSPATSFLIMSVTRNKYWSATLDGNPIQLRPVNIAYQGVIVPPGRHTVRMVYENTLVVAGGLVSLLSAFMLMVVLIRSRDPELVLPGRPGGFGGDPVVS
ncbi:MAG: hypothetical protein ABI718_15905 [Acidobacteriota bacterium]